MRVTAAASATSPAESWLVSMRLTPDYAAASRAPDRAARKVAAVAAIVRAEDAAFATVRPSLEQLRAAGLITGWERIPRTGALLVSRARGADDAALEQALRGLDALDLVIPNSVSQPLAADDDRFSVPHGEHDAWQAAKIGADVAWSQGVDGRGVTIGFVDSGADASHELLAGRYRGARADGSVVDDHNFYDAIDPRTTRLHDAWGHGTATTSVAVGDGSMRTGIAPGATFIAARAFGRGVTDMATKLRAMSWMLAPTDSAGKNADPTLAPDVVNMSFGDRDEQGLRFADVLGAYEAAGIVAVAAAGNGGRRGAGSVLIPAGFATVLGVGYTDRTDRLDDGSAVGPGPVNGPDGAPLSKPDVVAPGVDVVGARLGGGIIEHRGSSMSSAVASGAVALLLQRYPQLTPAQVREALRSTAVDVGEPGWDARSGAGRIDVPAALARSGQLVGER